MLKNIVKLEVQVAEKVYHLLCDSDSPIPHVKEALFRLNSIIAGIEQENAKNNSKEEEKEEVKPQETAA